MRFHREDLPLIVLWPVYLVFLVGGIGAHVLYGGAPADMPWTAPLFLGLAAAIAVAGTPQWWKPLAMAAIIGYLAELVGVLSGYPFGAYQYTTALKPLLFGVPLVVAGAWMVLFAYVSQMRLPPVLSAAWMTALDLVIDPLASNELGYWTWIDKGPYFGVPVLNFVGWFAVSLLIFYLSPAPPPRSSSTQMLGRTIVFFFAAVAAAHHYLLPAFLGLALAFLGHRRFRLVRGRAGYSPETS